MSTQLHRPGEDTLSLSVSGAGLRNLNVRTEDDLGTVMSTNIRTKGFRARVTLDDCVRAFKDKKKWVATETFRSGGKVVQESLHPTQPLDRKKGAVADDVRHTFSVRLLVLFWAHARAIVSRSD
jgi:hypothetical protein